ncbi:lipid IV(A) 3-deoxy-D-manno-octulosonic acid transferase [Methylosarcina fibrata]|uniref:lipid IV(A) 3-deoxy-D-manno-octulosonic acid transferase n=1 Tax=Methylosarcina fibrata TaxID=105972 RepID=UPI000379CA6D|nr:lipid IV(A) 3-deoxy-D-manno-octulosonic acid transferase [Methylosarcina fibrata]
MRTLYSAFFYLLIPFILLRLLWRSLKAPAYRRRWPERFGFYGGNPADQGVLWFHAVSVGEAEALFPLLRRLQQRRPEAPILVTTTTPTGSARVQAMMKDTVAHVYLPYDVPFVLRRFMRRFKPKLAVIMETEIWPNLFASCGEHKVPLYIINARLSEKSALGYRKIPALIRPALAEVRLIAAQTGEDARRFLDIGAAEESVKTLGNMKFDVDIPEETLVAGFKLKEHWFKGRFVWLLASTHKDEETVFFPIYKKLKQRIPELLMVIVPRHPERFPEVGKLCEQNRLHAVTRTSRMACSAATDVYLADTMGELKMFYASADIAFVGGSMVPVGGHNILEAAAVGVPVMFGPYMANFREIAGKVLERGAAVQCLNEEEIAKAVLKLYTHPEERDALVAKSRHFLNDNRGAIDRICDELYRSI